jgi:hypothetical protein
MWLPVSLALAVVAAFCTVTLLWPNTIKPALRRRYERAHQRRKARDNGR